VKGVTIRKYEEADYQTCVALSRELAEHHADIYEVPYSVLKDQGKWLDDLTNKDGFAGFWVAEEDGNVIGFFGLFVDGEEGEIEPVVVSSSFRNKGIGTTLIRYAVAEAKNRNIRYLSILPVARNIKAIKLFARMGFNMVGHIDLFQDLAPKADRTWKSGLVIHGEKIKY
jgi:N-acetylglutamate synthase-like GNAT family acetyltransferase